MNLYSEPLSILENVGGYKKSEMTKFQLSFLCGLIKEKRPSKVLEIGVSAGATSAVILNCLSKVNSNAKMYSVDLNQQCYVEESKETGYIIKEAQKFIKDACTHKLLLGEYAPYFLDEIGKGIDFLIIDTVHVLPGEILDFLAVLPYLTDDAIVVLHDVILHHENIECSEDAFATKVLLDSVVGEKIFLEDTGSCVGYPNIGAFKLNQDTKKYIWDVFSSLTIRWAYIPEEKELDIYRKWYEKFFEKEYIDLFEKTIMLNKASYERRKAKMQEEKNRKKVLIKEFYEALSQTDKRCLIYGASTCGKKMEQYIRMLGLSIDGFVVSDTENIELEEENVYKISELPYKKDECVILLGLDKKYHNTVRENLIGYHSVFPTESDGYDQFTEYIFDVV